MPGSILILQACICDTLGQEDRVAVLVGMDGSEGSRTALRWARRFSELMGFKLGAVRSWEYPPTAAMPGGPRPGSQVDTDVVVADELVGWVNEELGAAGQAVDALVERGAPASALLHVAAATRAELIVVGRRGLGAIAGRLLGSVSRRVVEQASCPVAVVPPLRDGDDGPVVVGVDGSSNASAAVDWATRVALAQRCDLVAVHAASIATLDLSFAAVEAMETEGQALVEEQLRPAVEAGAAVRYVVKTLDPRTLIELTAEEGRSRMVVVGTRGQGLGARSCWGARRHLSRNGARTR